MVSRFRFAVCAALLFLVQTTLAHRFSYGFLRADLLCVAAAYLALEADYSAAVWGAFALGVLRDLGSDGRLGTSSLLLVGVTAALLFLRQRLMRDSFLTDMVLTFAYVLALGLVHAFVVSVLVSGAEAGQLLGRAFGQAVFTTAVSPLLYALFARVKLVDHSARSPFPVP